MTGFPKGDPVFCIHRCRKRRPRRSFGRKPENRTELPPYGGRNAEAGVQALAQLSRELDLSIY